MASSGGETLGVFLNTNYSGGGPDYRWRYAWQYDAGTDTLTLTLTLEGYSTTTGVSVYIGMTTRTTGTPWIRAYCNDQQFYSESSSVDYRHSVSGWQDMYSVTHTITGTGGQATISLLNYGRARWGRSNINQYSDNTNTFTISADRGLVYISTGSGYVPAIPYISDGTAWRQCIPYMSNGSTWEICS